MRILTQHRGRISLILGTKCGVRLIGAKALELSQDVRDPHVNMNHLIGDYGRPVVEKELKRRAKLNWSVRAEAPDSMSSSHTAVMPKQHT